jgi:hypothetical protein
MVTYSSIGLMRFDAHWLAARGEGPSSTCRPRPGGPFYMGRFQWVGFGRDLKCISGITFFDRSFF